MRKETNGFKKIEEQASFNVNSLAKELTPFYNKSINSAYEAIIKHLSKSDLKTSRKEVLKTLIQERVDFNILSLAKRLKKFYPKNTDRVQAAYKDIINYLKINPKASKGRTYEDLSKGKGIPTTYVRGKKENTPKAGHSCNGRRMRSMW